MFQSESKCGKALFFIRDYVPSSVIKTFHYDPDKKNLVVVFLSGMVYKYKDVPESMFLKMKNSFSKGTFLNKFIKGRYEFEKVS